MDSANRDKQTQDIGAQLGRKAGRLFKTGGPRAKRAIEENRPKAEQASRNAVRYAQDHQDEIKAVAMRGARMRLGPWGMVLDALGLGGGSQPAENTPEAQTAAVCEACQSPNSRNARFCNQCGARLQPQA